MLFDVPSATDKPPGGLLPSQPPPRSATVPRRVAAPPWRPIPFSLILAFGLLGIILVAYIVWLLIASGGVTNTLVSGWGVDLFELVVAVLCGTRAFVGRPRRAMPLYLGGGLLFWCAGDVTLTIESLGGRTPAVPSLADAFYLGFYPLAYVAVFLFLRTELRRLTSPSWLDGAVAGLGAAAVCAAFAFHSIVLSTGGSAISAAVNLAYPVGDLVLLALVIGATAVLPGRTKAPWILLAGACSLNAAGDTFNLFQSSFGGSTVGTVLGAVSWPGAFLLMTVAVWLPRHPANPQASARPTGFLFPGLAAAAGLTILVTGAIHRLSLVSVGLATTTLLLVGIRLMLSARALRLLTARRHHQSLTDDLTGLGNRRYLFEMLDRFFEDDRDPLLPKRPLAFLFLDLDHFKEINDYFGHHAGDELLRQIGPRLNDSLRASDVVVRLGGDEFAVVLLNADATYATGVAERILASLREPFALDVMNVTVGASIGIAFAPADAHNTTALLRCADAAMYRGKLQDDSIETYSLQLDDEGNLLRLAEELRLAIDKGQFVVHYQPQLDLRTGEIAGVEALLRWAHPRLGLVPPIKFIPIAEEAGLMPSLTALVLGESLRQCGAWRAAGDDITVAINVSPSNLLEAGFIDRVKAQLDRHGVPASALVLEITETCIISDYERSRAVIQELHDLGLIISIDDFGAGFTSLVYLRDLAVGELKLDRMFVTGLISEDSERDRDLVRSTIELGHALGLRVIAEGVEDLATLDKLGQLGCDMAQGYFVARPAPAAQVVLRSDIAMWAEAVLRAH